MTQPTYALVNKKVINMDVTNKHYSALTIDTSIFEKNGLKLNKGLLAQLHQFKDNPIKLILSDIVYRELKSHLNRKEKETKSKIASALNDASDYLNCCIDDMEKIKSLIKINYEMENISNLILEDFIRKCGIELVKGVLVHVFTMIFYFATNILMDLVGIESSIFNCWSCQMKICGL